MDHRPWQVVSADKFRELEFQPWCSLRFGLEIGRDKSRLAGEHFATFSLHNTINYDCIYILCLSIRMWQTHDDDVENEHL